MAPWHHRGVTDDELFDDLSRRLREAHRRVRSVEATPDEKARVTKRLLAISDAAKHDLARASTRLDALIADLAAGSYPRPEA